MTCERSRTLEVVPPAGLEHTEVGDALDAADRAADYMIDQREVVAAHPIDLTLADVHSNQRYHLTDPQARFPASYTRRSRRIEVSAWTGVARDRAGR